MTTSQRPTHEDVRRVYDEKWLAIERLRERNPYRASFFYRIVAVGWAIGAAAVFGLAAALPEMAPVVAWLLAVFLPLLTGYGSAFAIAKWIADRQDAEADRIMGGRR